MTCDSCVKDVSETLYKLQGIKKVEANLKDQLVSIEGTVAPSAIVEAIQATGRDAILRGSGTSNSAAVSILETYYHRNDQQPQHNDDASDFPLTHGDFGPSKRHVRGLARMVQVGDNVTLVDLTLRGVSPGTYRASIREYGNLAEGATSTGPVWSGPKPGSIPRGALGIFQVGPDGRGSAFLDCPFRVWEVIGHAMAVTKQNERDGQPLRNDEDTVVGVIARSAGVWDNDKTVCSCTGKTLWEERRDEVKNGML